MKKFLMALMLCLVSIMSFGQERVNRVKLNFVSEGPIIKHVAGWAYDESVGEWVNYENVLDGNKSDAKYMNSIKSYMMSQYLNNIISLQFKTITCNEVPYYVLIWETWNGAYKYPSIQEDWEYWKIKKFMMFTVEDMEKFRNLTNKPQVIVVPTPKRGRYDERRDEDVIQTEMSSKYPSEQCIVIYKATDGSIRFRFQYFPSVDEIVNEYFELSELDYIRLFSISL